MIKISLTKTDYLFILLALVLTGLGVTMSGRDLGILCFGAGVLVAILGFYHHSTNPHFRRIVASGAGCVVVVLVAGFVQKLRTIPNDRFMLMIILCVSVVIFYLLS